MRNKDDSNCGELKQPMTYHDFNLRFADYDPESGKFKVWVEGDTPGGAMRPDDAVECVFRPTDFWKDPERGRGGLVGNVDRRKNLTREAMFELGKLLADLALPVERVRPLFLQSRRALKDREGLRIRLRTDPVELSHLPWEFMAIPQTLREMSDTDFLALCKDISIVRSDTVEAPPKHPPRRNTVRVAAIVSCPDDQDDLDVDEDKRSLAQAIAKLNETAGREVVNIAWAESSTRQALETVLQNETDIFHYSGHASYDALTKEGMIVLENAEEKSDYYESVKLAQLLRNANIRLAVLCACETGRRDGKNIWTGLAPALTREQVPAVVANQFKIKDTNAMLLTAYVYQGIFSGCSVDEALFYARQSIYQAGGLENRDWGTPVLYHRDRDGILFPLQADDLSGDNPFIEVANTFNSVKGRVVEVDLDEIKKGHISVRDNIDTVENGAEFTSVRIKTFG